MGLQLGPPLRHKCIPVACGSRPTITVAFLVIHRGVDNAVDTLCRLTVTQSSLPIEITYADGVLVHLKGIIHWNGAPTAFTHNKPNQLVCIHFFFCVPLGWVKKLGD